MVRKERKVQVLLNEFRYSATELNGALTIHRDGGSMGKATWQNDQLILSSAVLPDEVVLALEKKLKEAIDADWWED